MLTCREVARLSSDALEQQLPFGQVVSIRTHLFLCGACRRYVQQLKALHRLARRLGRESPAAARLSDHARERLRKAVARETGDPA